MIPLPHSLSGALSIAVSVTAFTPYLWGIHKKKVRPHLIGWLIWSVLTAIVFLAQLASGGGYGAWATGVISALCIIAFIASLSFGDKTCTVFDGLCLGLTAVAIALWLLSGTPLYSVILLTFIELLGFGAMTRKTYTNPYSESLAYFALSIIKYALGALALDVWSWETALYPVATGIMTFSFTLFIALRRLSLREKQRPV